MKKKNHLNNTEKVEIFQSFFSGLKTAYGTYDPRSGKSWQIKAPATCQVIRAHLQGKRPYGVYLLDGSRTQAVVADFDSPDPFPPVSYVNAARRYGLDAYIEVSKSQNYHCWIFFCKKGVEACKARLIAKNILYDIGHPRTEIFPKHDSLNGGSKFGNFINAPLYGGLVPTKRTVFIDPKTQAPYPDQWEFLRSIRRASEEKLDEIIEINELSDEQALVGPQLYLEGTNMNRFSLPFCARKMLTDGVVQYQRVSCFRLANHIKRAGIPQDLAITMLKAWALKNRPDGNCRIITHHEINEQVSYAYKKNYRGYGCQSEAVAPYCHPECPVKSYISKNTDYMPERENGNEH